MSSLARLRELPQPDTSNTPIHTRCTDCTTSAPFAPHQTYVSRPGSLRIDTPTLIGVWESEPYFDGSASDLGDVFKSRRHHLPTRRWQVNGAQVRTDSSAQHDNSAHEIAVYLPNRNKSVLLSGINGGNGGAGQLQIQPMRSRPSASRFDRPMERDTADVPANTSKSAWREVFIDNVALNAGPQITSASSLHAEEGQRRSPSQSGTADDVAAAQAHLQVADLTNRK